MHNNSQEYTFFFHLTSPFSNFHPSKFEYKEFTFISNEQFMMFSKAKTFKDEVTAQKIIDLNNHQLAKDFISGKISRTEIIENKVSGRFMMYLKFDKDDEQTIISSDNYEKYKELSNDFFKKFIKYGGNIDLADVFVDD